MCSGAETSAEDAETSTETLEDHPLMQTIGMLDQKQAEMHQHVATLSAHVQVIETENTVKLKATIEQLEKGNKREAQGDADGQSPPKKLKTADETED